MKYKFFKSICSLIFLCVLSINAQEDSMNLPEVNEKLGSLMTPYFALKVLDNNQVVLNKDTIPIHRIKEYVYLTAKNYKMYRFMTILFAKSHLHLFADKNISYKTIDAIKTQLSATNKSRYLIYRSNIDSGYQSISKAKGIKHKSPPSFFKLDFPEYRKTKKQLKEEDSIRKEEEKKSPELAEMNRLLNDDPKKFQSFYSLESAIYSYQQNIIDEVLSNKTYKCYTITNSGFKDANKSYSYSDLELVLSNSDVVFLNYDSKLTYGNYLNFISELHNYAPNFRKKKGIAEVIELSHQIQLIHDIANIRLCD